MRTRLEPELRRWNDQARKISASAKKPTNMAKISKAFQKPDESPVAFYEILCEAYRIYTPFKPEALENIIAAAFRGLGSQTDQKGKQEYISGGKGRGV